MVNLAIFELFLLIEIYFFQIAKALQFLKGLLLVSATKLNFANFINVRAMSTDASPYERFDFRCDFYLEEFKPAMSIVQPAGRMRPSRRFCAAHFGLHCSKSIQHTDNLPFI